MIRLTCQKGQALVELAICLMLLFTIVFGITEFGRAMYIQNTLTNAAREGARWVVVQGSPSVSQSALLQRVGPFIPFEHAALTATCTPNTALVRGQAVLVEVSLPFQPVVPLISRFFSPNTRLRGRAQMLYEG